MALDDFVKQLRMERIQQENTDSRYIARLESNIERSIENCVNEVFADICRRIAGRLVDGQQCSIVFDIDIPKAVRLSDESGCPVEYYQVLRPECAETHRKMGLSWEDSLVDGAPTYAVIPLIKNEGDHYLTTQYFLRFYDILKKLCVADCIFVSEPKARKHTYERSAYGNKSISDTYLDIESKQKGSLRSILNERITVSYSPVLQIRYGN